jgi:DGQHR domain-containing protein
MNNTPEYSTDPAISSELVVPAIRIQQGKKQTIYAFAIDGKLLPEITTISRVKRDEKRLITGYQRPEISPHVDEIRRYLESSNPLLPNALVVAFTPEVTFNPEQATPDTLFGQLGKLIIPVDKNQPDEDKPGWIVDGQQRTAAIQKARLKNFNVCVIAFITKDTEEQREQFILVNETKALPSLLIDELLPSTQVQLPKRLSRRVLPNQLIERLNSDHDSPFHGLIKTQTRTEGVISAGPLVTALSGSITNGALYEYRDPKTGEGDIEKMLLVLKRYWCAVKESFPKAWGLPSRKSRLMHGTGIRSMSFLMDEILASYADISNVTESDFHNELQTIIPFCKWTTGTWKFSNGDHKKWNEIQNLSGDRDQVTRFLVRCYHKNSN